MPSNPPYGKSWKIVPDRMGGKAAGGRPPAHPIRDAFLVFEDTGQSNAEPGRDPRRHPGAGTGDQGVARGDRRGLSGADRMLYFVFLREFVIVSSAISNSPIAVERLPGSCNAARAAGTRRRVRIVGVSVLFHFHARNYNSAVGYFRTFNIGRAVAGIMQHGESSRYETTSAGGERILVIPFFRSNL